MSHVRMFEGVPELVIPDNEKAAGRAMAPLRNHTFFSLGELREGVRGLREPEVRGRGPEVRRGAGRAHAGWTPSRLIAWGRSTGPHTAAFVEQLLDSRPHPEQGYRSCLGLKALLRAYGAERLEAACRRALDIGTLSYKSVKSILATGLDQADDQQYTLSLPGHHANIRGPGYYTTPQNGKES